MPLQPPDRVDELAALVRLLDERMRAVENSRRVAVGTDWRIEQSGGAVYAVNGKTPARVNLTAPKVRISAEPGNALRLGADGALFVPELLGGAQLAAGVVASADPLTVTIDGTTTAAQRIAEHEFAAAAEVWVLISEDVRLIIGSRYTPPEPPPEDPLSGPTDNVYTFTQYDFVLGEGWHAEHTSRHGDPANPTPWDPDDELDSDGASGRNTGSAQSRAVNFPIEPGSGESIFGWATEVRDSTHFITVPLAVLRAHMNAVGLPAGDEVDACTLVFSVRGDSFDKNALPWYAMPGGFANQGWAAGTGTLRISGAATTDITGDNSWDTVTVPAVRDQSFAQGTGGLIATWTLDELPSTGADGIASFEYPPLELRYPLTVGQARTLDHIVLQLNVSPTEPNEHLAAPAGDPYDPGTPGGAEWLHQQHYYENDLNVIVDVEFGWNNA